MLNLEPEAIRARRVFILKVAAVPALIFIALLGSQVFVIARTEYRFNNIAPRLARQVTGDELQTWAQAVITSPRAVAYLSTNDGYEPRLSELQPQPPGPLLEIFPRGPKVTAHDPGDGTPRYVTVTWGSGHLGTYGIEIGPTNFTGKYGRTNWQAGIYYWCDR